MRILPVLSVLLFLSPVAHGQDQESQLVTRLLRPKTDLKNPSQEKKFLADKRSIDKKASVQEFYFTKRSSTKEFSGTRDYSSWEYNARAYHGQRKANMTSRSLIANANRQYAPENKVRLRSSADANRKVADRKYAGERPFLDKGKSQKALSQHDTPLTIDQVRDLLNKK